MATTVISMDGEIYVFYHIVDANGDPYKNSEISSASISPQARLFQLRNAVVARNKNLLANVDPDALDLFASRDDLILDHPLDVVSLRVSSLTTSSKAPLHVAVPCATLPSEQSVRGPPYDALVTLHLERRKRWALINAAIGKTRKRKNCDTDEISQQLTWTDVEDIYYPISSKYDLVPRKVPDEEFDGLYKYLSKAGRSFSSIGLGSDAMRLHFIAPVLVHVCNLFDGEAKILVEQSIDGKNLLVHGKFEFILQRKGKRICIVEAKLDDLEQGLVQDLLGCEAMAEMENLECVYGIVTNYPTWIFIKSLDNRIETCELSLGITHNRTPTKDTLQAVVGSIYAMLSD